MAATDGRADAADGRWSMLGSLSSLRRGRLAAGVVVICLLAALVVLRVALNDATRVRREGEGAPRRAVAAAASSPEEELTAAVGGVLDCRLPATTSPEGPGGTCPPDAGRGLSRLTSALRRDPDSGLCPLRAERAAAAGAVLFAGLDARAFRGERIAFVGDSTLRYAAQSLQLLLHDNCTHHIAGGRYRVPRTYRRNYVLKLGKTGKAVKKKASRQDLAQVGKQSKQGKARRRKRRLSSDHFRGSLNTDQDLGPREDVDRSLGAENTHNHSSHLGNGNATISLTEATMGLFAKAPRCAPPVQLWLPETPVHVHPTADNRTLVTWAGIDGQNYGSNDTDVLLGAAWEEAREARPTVLVANMGLHWLHLAGHGRLPPAGDVARWRRYEAGWLDEVVDRARGMRGTVRLLLFKTTNAVCDARLRGADGVGMDAYARARAAAEDRGGGGEDGDALARCRRLVRDRDGDNEAVSGAIIPGARSAADYCRDGTFDEHGARVLNRRLYRYVGRLLSPSAAREDLPFKVGIYDDAGTESCAHTRDGKHYQPLLLARLRLLSNILSCQGDWSHDQWKGYADLLLRNSPE